MMGVYKVFLQLEQKKKYSSKADKNAVKI